MRPYPPPKKNTQAEKRQRDRDRERNCISSRGGPEAQWLRDLAYGRPCIQVQAPKGFRKETLPASDMLSNRRQFL